MLELNYENLKIQRYLTSNIKMSDAEKCLLFKCRVRELPVKANYRNRYQNVKCSLCREGFDDTQYHLFHCVGIIAQCDILANNVEMEYEDIFGDISRQIPVAKLLSEIWTNKVR